MNHPQDNLYADVEASARAYTRRHGETHTCDLCGGPLDQGSIRVGDRLLCDLCAYDLSKEGTA
jgi:formylmethanofuran dehydrogenase subunit E